MANEKTYGVKALSELAQVSVRTLHYYDEVGLLKAKRNPLNGYRFYSTSDAVCLQQITLYRELDMSIDEIKQILTSSDSLMGSLQKQHALMQQRQSETQSIIDNLELAMSALRGENNLDILFQSIPVNKAQHWKDKICSAEDGLGEAVLRAYGGFSGSQIEQKAAFAEDWCQRYTAVLSKKFGDPIVQCLIGESYVTSNQEIAAIAPEMADQFLDSEGFRTFANMQQDNNVLEDMYGHYAKGFAEHLYQAMLHFCEHELMHNSAHWIAKVQHS